MKKFVLLLTLLVGVSTLASPTTLPFQRTAQVVLTQTAELDAGDSVDAGEAPDAGVAALPIPSSVDVDISTVAPLLKLIFDAVTTKNWVLAAAMLVSLLVLVLRWASKKFGILPFFTTDRGGVVLTFLLAFAGGFSNALVTGGVSAVNTGLLLQCFMVATYAIGGFVGVKKLFFPSDAK